jgi:DNA-binding transcriptional regulator YiaG
LAIVEITPDFTSLTTTDRLIETIRNSPQGLTIRELSDTLNRPISMLQICLKTSIASQKVALVQRQRGDRSVKVYILKADKPHDRSWERSLTSDGYSSLTPIDLREAAGLTKIQLATELGLSIRTINDWEQKRTQPKLAPSQLKQMLSVYQCTLDRLIAAFE